MHGKCLRCGEERKLFRATASERRILGVPAACHECLTVAADAETVSLEELQAASAIWDRITQAPCPNNR